MMQEAVKSMVSPTKLKSMRVENGWSQEKLASVTGLSLRTIQRIEKDGKCSVESKLAIAAALNMTPSELLHDYPEKVGDGTLNYGGMVGLLSIVGLCSLLVAWEWKNPEIFINPMNALFIGLTVFGLSMMSSGFQATVNALGTVVWIFKQPQDQLLAQAHLPVLRRALVYCYTAGVIWTLTEVVEAGYYGSQASNKSMSLNDILFSMQSLLYAVMLAEFLIRPLMNRITWLLSRQY